MRFTAKYIANLKPKAKMYQVRETGGFGIRILPSGVKIWIFVYTRNGKRRQMNLGDYPDISLAKARDRLLSVRRTYKDGEDPQEVGFAWHQNRAKEKHEADQEAEDVRNRLTVQRLATAYLNLHAKVNKRASSWKEDKRLLAKNILPQWGDRNASDISKRDCVALLDTFRDRPALCHNILKLTRKMFNFALERDLLDATPFYGIKPPVQIFHRERVLTENEIRAFWTTELPKASMSEEVKGILKLALLTGQRIGEVCGIAHREIDGSWWTIPGERTKNGVPHRVFLTASAHEILANHESEYCFPSPKTSCRNEKGIPCSSHISENAVSYAIRRNLKDYIPRRPIKGKTVSMVRVREDKKMELEHFTPHDLRRTCATFLAQLGHADEIIDAVLNHEKTGVIKIYNRHKYDTEKKLALESWERKLHSIIDIKPENEISVDGTRDAS